MKITIINGPNLNMLGHREPKIYGTESLEDINTELQTNFSDVTFDFIQSNSESDLINFIHTIKADYIIINPAAFTHTSVAIRDAINSIDIPFYEVHLSNIFTREPFRQHSFFSDKAIAVICGLGKEGYASAVRHIIHNSKR